MTRDQHKQAFLQKFRGTLAGTIALGGEHIRKSLAGGHVDAKTFGEALLHLGPATTNLLIEMFDFLYPPEPPKDAPKETKK